MNMMSTYYRSGAYKMTQGKSFHRGTTYSFHRGTVKGYPNAAPAKKSHTTTGDTNQFNMI